MVTTQPNRVLLVVAALVAVAAVVTGVLLATRHEPRYDRGTPAGVVQAYVSAVIDGDSQEAADLLAPDSPCDLTDLDRAHAPDDVRVVLRATEVRGGTARVEVEMATSSGDLLGGSEQAERHTFQLTRPDQAWLITGMPWPMYECPEE